MGLTSFILPKVHTSEMIEPSIFGLLNLNKPRGRTSRWVVDQVKRLVRPAKVGHAGTLDPLATGVLIVAVGPATRLVEYVREAPKQYRAEFLLGRTSDTEDTQGHVSELLAPRTPSRAEIETTAARFVGEIHQRPPAFSAIKVSGKRAYALARKGQEVELEPRAVTIHRLNILDYVYPRLTLDIECSSGTYVRSLGRDVAKALGSGAVMSALERTAIGEFHVAHSIDVALLSLENLREHLLPARLAVAHLPSVTLAESDAQRIARGQSIDGRAALGAAPESREFAGFDGGGNLVGILTRREGGLLGPALNLAAGAR